jgi:nitrogen fixation/metabolism regulation signal transduction histidine kinase
MNFNLKFKLNSFTIINTVVTLGIILLGANLYYKIKDSYTNREFMMDFNVKVQEARISEKAYLQFYEVGFVNNLFSKVDEINKNLAIANIEIEYKQKLTEQLNNYKSIFSKVIELHEKNVQLNQGMLDKIKDLNHGIVKIYSELAEKENQLQMEGTNLQPTEATLVTVTSELNNLILTLRLTFIELLRTGDVNILKDFYLQFNDKFASLAAALEMLTIDVNNGAYKQIGIDMRGKFTNLKSSLEIAKNFLLQQKQTIVDLDVLGNTLNQTINNLLQKELIDTEKRINVIVWVILLVILVSIFASIVYATLLSKNIIHTLIKVVNFAEEVGKGSFNKQLQCMQKDEFGRLSMSLNKMAVNLEKNKKDQEENIKKLENI